MSEVALRAQNISKLYQLGSIGSGTLRDDISRWWAGFRGAEDPFLKIGQVNDRSKKVEGDYVWALRNIDFEVKKGEVLGIIGKNGAGKSTLLKILSKITSPTEGKIMLNGRVASLLEVGTGFHPELTGRENIFMNGAILGMRKWEIKKKFDEIVDFSGVEAYIDTPVKRYSSGMYIRLAFGVAAFLEPEILIIDEVLAVGDAEFQKKCLGRMKEVSLNEGRTVLFVSHNMEAIARICENTLVLNKGTVEFNGSLKSGIKVYYGKENKPSFRKSWSINNPGNEVVQLLEVSLIDSSGREKDAFDITEEVGVLVKYEVLKNEAVITHGLNLYNEDGIHILSSHDTDTGKLKKKFTAGIHEALAWIPGNLLAEGLISVSVAIMSYDPFIVHFHEMDVLSFSVLDKMDGTSVRGVYGGAFPGVVRPVLKWSGKQSNQ